MLSGETPSVLCNGSPAVRAASPSPVPADIQLMSPASFMVQIRNTQQRCRFLTAMLAKLNWGEVILQTVPFARLGSHRENTKFVEATLTRKPNPLDSRDTGAGVLKTALWGFSPPCGSSPGLGDRPRGECPGLRSVSFWPGNFQRVEKVHKLSPHCPPRLLRPFSVPTHPPIEPEDEHRVYFRRAGLPRPPLPT